MAQFELLDESLDDNNKWAEHVKRGAIFYPRALKIGAIATVVLGVAFYGSLGVDFFLKNNAYLRSLLLLFLGMTIATGAMFFFQEQNKREIALLNDKYTQTNANLWIWLIGTLLMLIAVMWGVENLRVFRLHEVTILILVVCFWCMGVYLAIQFALFLDTQLKQTIELSRQIRFLYWLLGGWVVLAAIVFFGLGAADDAAMLRGDHILVAIMGVVLMGVAMLSSVVALLIQCYSRKKFL